MLAEDVKVDFMGFEPTPDLRRKVYFLLNRLNQKSPSRSLMTATFQLTNGVFEGVIRITTAAEEFAARAKHGQLGDLSHELVERALAHLERWKAQRFEK